MNDGSPLHPLFDDWPIFHLGEGLSATHLHVSALLSVNTLLLGYDNRHLQQRSAATPQPNVSDTNTGVLD